MAVRSRSLLAAAKHRFPVRLRLAIPPDGFGRRLDRMHAWLDENCGADGWTIAPPGLPGVVNGAVTLYFRDPAAAAELVARWRVRPAPAIADGAFVMRDEPEEWRGAALHGTP